MFLLLKIFIAFLLWFGSFVFSLRFLPADSWRMEGRVQASGIGLISAYFWKPNCPGGFFRLGDAMTTTGQPPSPNTLACVQGQPGEVSGADRFLLVWTPSERNLNFYRGYSDGPMQTLGTIVSSADVVPGVGEGVGKKRQISFDNGNPSLRFYAVLASNYCQPQAVTLCNRVTTYPLARPVAVFDPFQNLNFSDSGSLFVFPPQESSPIVECLTTNCACSGCVNGICSFEGCNCFPGWTGEHCELDIDECAAHIANCDPLVQCINLSPGYKCGPCPPNFYDPPPPGTNCTIIDRCKLPAYYEQCQREGLNCTNLPDSFRCTSCPPGFLEMPPYNYCVPQTCGNGRIDPGEQCDSGNGCFATNCSCAPGFEPMSPPTVDCQRLCGNHRLDPGEECDGGIGCALCRCNRALSFVPMNSTDCYLLRDVDIGIRICSANNPRNCSECMRNPCVWCRNTARCSVTRDGPTCFTFCDEPNSGHTSGGPSPSHQAGGDVSKLLAIVLPLGIGLIGLVVGILVAVYWAKKKREQIKDIMLKLVRSSEEHHRHNILFKNSFTEWHPPQNFEFIPLARLPIVFSKETLDFGNASNQFKVNFVYHDKIILFHRSSKKKTKQRENKRRIGSESMDKPLIESPQSELIEDTKHAIKFEFHVPQSHKYSIELNPKSGVIKKDKEVEIDVTLKMNMTTEVEVKIGLELPEKKKYSYLRFFVTSELSPIIDMDEVTFNSSKPIGDGGYGTVYRGTYRGQDVAVKMLKIQDLPQKMLDEFEREIDLLSKLRHKNVVQFIGASTVIGRLAILTEFIELGSANSLLFKSNVQLPYALKVKIALDAARALQFLHHNNILHRDIKPDNLLVVSTSLTAPINVKLTDFGTSREITGEISNKYTQAIGTPTYMAPEILSKQSYGKEADVYSFGVLLWVIYTQKEPYSQLKSILDVAQHVLSGKREDIPPDCPTEYRELIEKCWAHNLNERPSFDDVVAKLEQIWRSLNADKKENTLNNETKNDNL